MTDLKNKKRKKNIMKNIFISILTIITIVSMGIGFAVIISSPDENPVSLQVKRSMERGKKAIHDSDINNDGEAASSYKPGLDDDDWEDVRENYEKKQLKKLAANTRVTAIGDSVMLGAAPALQRIVKGIEIDAEESRQVNAGIDIVKSLKDAGKLEKDVVIELGTNKVITEDSAQGLVDAIGTDHNIYWIKVYAKDQDWTGDINKIIDDIGDKNANVTAVDWPGLAKSHPEWFYGDGVHINIKGQEGFAQMLNKALGR
ncbi:MAG: hypothetical protein VZR00_06205 [Lachnospiraceae bacterium]|jgi:lysophospholipase L1-like esterase|nr:hypothetical protein [Lachnospiraceae bacterium]MEE3461469.1 hypothetical protein [Lachnospiraceae bacterium]